MSISKSGARAKIRHEARMDIRGAKKSGNTSSISAIKSRSKKAQRDIIHYRGSETKGKRISVENARKIQNKASKKALAKSGVSSAYIGEQAKRYGKNISSKDMQKILTSWKASQISQPVNQGNAFDIIKGYAGKAADDLRGGVQDVMGSVADKVSHFQREQDITNLQAGERERESSAAGASTNLSQNREAASSWYDKIKGGITDTFGIPKANAETGQQGGGGGSWSGQQNQGWLQEVGNKVGRGIQLLTDPLNMAGKASNLVGKNINNPITDLMNSLGLAGSKGGLVETGNPYVSDLGDVLAKASKPDQPTGYGSQGEIFYNGNTNPGPLNSDFGFGYSRPGSESAALAGVSPMDYGAVQRQRTQDAGVFPTPQLYNPNVAGASMAPTPGFVGPSSPSALSAIGARNDQVFGGNNHFATPLSTGISGDNVPVSPTYAPRFPGLTDKTPIQGDNGTVQQFLGSGRLSGGAFSNGKGNLNLGGMMGGGSPFGSDLSSILGQKANAQSPLDQAFSTLDDYKNVNQNLIKQGQDIISSIDPKLAATNQEYAGLVKQFSDMVDQQMPTANQNYNLPNTSMANLNLTGGSALSSTQPGDVMPLVKESTKSSKTSKTKKSKDPYQQMIDQQNQFYADQTATQNASIAQQKADREKILQSILSGLDTQYSQTQQTGQSELDKAKQQDLLKLSGQFSFANSDPNDEQRIQYQNRLTSDYTTQLQDLIAKLAAAKGQDYNTAQTNYSNQNLSADQANQQTMAQLAASRQNSLQSIMQAKLAAQQRQQELDQQMAQQQWANNMESKKYYTNLAQQEASNSQSQQKYQNDLLQSILAQGANMQSGGREYVQNLANTMGLGNVGAYTPDNWENAYRMPTKSQSMINLGGGKVLDPNTGDVYDTNS